MSTDKKDLEIVYNLQWKRRINNGDDKANIVGMLDTPSTTLNWDVFKSYLLKNAGAFNQIGDINVSYIDSDDDEIPIDSQTEFQAALYSFRKRAHAGDTITLRLDKVSNFEMKPMDSQHAYLLPDHSSNVQKNDQTKHVQHSTHDHDLTYGFDVMTHSDSDIPLWFQKYMNKFKSQIVEEITTSVVSQLKNQAPVSCSHTRKLKSEPTKLRHKKLALHNVEPLKEQTKEYVKALKIERKLDNKLEKLEYKTKKIKEKKSQLGKHSEYSAVRRPIGQPLTTNELLMDAAPLDRSSAIPAPHFVGGETFVQEWNVINNGQLPWTEETELRHAWGSQSLTPLKRSVRCPPLQPGESGVVKVILQIPTAAGNYECYWHFHQANRRFGHWLGCQIIVDSTLNNADYAPSPKITKRQLFKEENLFCGQQNQIESDILYQALPNAATDDVVQQQENKNMTSSLNVTTDGGCDDNSSDFNNFNIKMINSLCIRDDSSIDSSENSEYEVICIPNYKEIEKQDVAADFVQVQGPHLLVTSSSDQGSDDNNNNNNNLEMPENVVATAAAAADVKEVNSSSVVQHKHENAIVAVDSSLKQEPDYDQQQHQFSDNYVPNIEEVPNAAPQVLMKDEMCDSAFFDPLLQQSSWKQMDDSLLSMSKLLTQPLAPPAAMQIVSTPFQQLQQQQHQFMPICPISQQQQIWQHEVQQLQQQQHQQAANNFNGGGYTYGACQMYHGAPAGIAASQPPPLYCETDADGRTERRLFVFPHKCPGYEVVDVSHEWNIQSPPPPPGGAGQGGREEGAASASSAASTYAECGSRVSNSQYSQTYAASNVDLPYCKSPTAENGMKNAEVPPVGSGAAQPPPPTMPNPGPSVQLLPETFVTGAVNVASSAINTARSVLHMLRPTPYHPRDWSGAAWAPAANKDPVVEDALRRLQEMGFWNRELNISLLARHKNDIEKVISDLVQ